MLTRQGEQPVRFHGKMCFAYKCPCGGLVHFRIDKTDDHYKHRTRTDHNNVNPIHRAWVHQGQGAAGVAAASVPGRRALSPVRARPVNLPIANHQIGHNQGRDRMGGFKYVRNIVMAFCIFFMALELANEMSKKEPAELTPGPALLDVPEKVGLLPAPKASTDPPVYDSSSYGAAMKYLNTFVTMPILTLWHRWNSMASYEPYNSQI